MREKIELAPSLYEALESVTEPLRAARIRYMLVGALAVFVHGDSRTTRDLDLTADVGHVGQAALIEVLKTSGYAVEGPTRNEFGLVLRVAHPFLPIEVFLTGTHALHEEEFERAVTVRIGEKKHAVLSAEHLLLRKLVAYARVRANEKDLLDAKSVVAANQHRLDLEFLRERAQLYRVDGFLERLLNDQSPGDETMAE